MFSKQKVGLEWCNVMILGWTIPIIQTKKFGDKIVDYCGDDHTEKGSFCLQFAVMFVWRLVIGQCDQVLSETTVKYSTVERTWHFTAICDVLTKNPTTTQLSALIHPARSLCNYTEKNNDLHIQIHTTTFQFEFKTNTISAGSTINFSLTSYWLLSIWPFRTSTIQNKMIRNKPDYQSHS